MKSFVFSTLLFALSFIVSCSDPSSSVALDKRAGARTPVAMEGMWRLRTFNYRFGPPAEPANPTAYALQNNGCSLSNRWLYLSPGHDGRTTYDDGYCYIWNYDNCAQSTNWADVATQRQYLRIGFETWSTFSQENITYQTDTGTPGQVVMQLQRAKNGTYVSETYGVTFAANGDMVWTTSGTNRTLTWMRSSGGPSVP